MPKRGDAGPTPKGGCSRIETAPKVVVKPHRRSWSVGPHRRACEAFLSTSGQIVNTDISVTSAQPPRVSRKVPRSHFTMGGTLRDTLRDTLKCLANANRDHASIINVAKKNSTLWWPSNWSGHNGTAFKGIRRVVVAGKIGKVFFNRIFPKYLFAL